MHDGALDGILREDNGQRYSAKAKPLSLAPFYPGLIEWNGDGKEENAQLTFFLYRLSNSEYSALACLSKSISDIFAVGVGAAVDSGVGVDGDVDVDGDGDVGVSNRWRTMSWNWYSGRKGSLGHRSSARRMCRLPLCDLGGGGY